MLYFHKTWKFIHCWVVFITYPSSNRIVSIFPLWILLITQVARYLHIFKATSKGYFDQYMIFVKLLISYCYALCISLVLNNFSEKMHNIDFISDYLLIIILTLWVTWLSLFLLKFRQLSSWKLKPPFKHWIFL